MSAPLPHTMKNHSELTTVARTTREKLREAFASRFTSRVWDSSSADPSFFRDAAVVLLPTFSSAKHLNMLKLIDGDDEGLPAAKAALVPTTDAEVTSAREKIWDEVRERAVKAALVEGAKTDDMANARASKRAKVSTPSGALNSGSIASSGSSAWAMFEHDQGEQDLNVRSPEAQEERRKADTKNAVNEEISRFKDAHTSTSWLPPRSALVFWSGSAKLQFPKLWRVAQQVYGNQSTAAQIERDFGSAGQLLSSRRSRLDGMYAEMMLFLHLNFKEIPQQIPAIKAASLHEYFPARFTGANKEFEEAMKFVNSGMNNGSHEGHDVEASGSSSDDE